MAWNMKKTLGSGALVAASLGLALAASVAPASAATTAPPAGLTLWSGTFTGQTVNYANVPATCTTLPFTAQAEYNGTSQNVLIYKTANCTGPALSFQANDIHSFTEFGGLSIKAG